MQFLRINDMYHSPWFLLILSLLGANLVVCSLDRLPGVLKAVKVDPELELARRLNIQETVTMPGGLAEASQSARAALAKAGGKVFAAEGEEKVTLFAHQGAWTRLGVYLVHSGVLLIFIGALLGGIFGYKGAMEITEGASVDHIDLGGERVRKLGFAVRLDKFHLKMYDNGQAKEFRSDLTFLRSGKPFHKESIIVNLPAEVEGNVFYQASYGKAPTGIKMRVAGNGAEGQTWVKYREWSDLPGGGKAAVVAFRDNIRMGDFYTGPAARVQVALPGKEPFLVTALGKNMKMPGKEPVTLTILEVKASWYTGLQVKYDPGVWFVWVGCTLMVASFFVAFYCSHRKMWIRLTPAAGGGITAELAGRANKNKLGLKRRLERLAAQLGQPGPDNPQTPGA